MRVGLAPYDPLGCTDRIPLRTEPSKNQQSKAASLWRRRAHVIPNSRSGSPERLFVNAHAQHYVQSRRRLMFYDGSRWSFIVPLICIIKY